MTLDVARMQNNNKHDFYVFHIGNTWEKYVHLDHTRTPGRRHVCVVKQFPLAQVQLPDGYVDLYVIK